MGMNELISEYERATNAFLIAAKQLRPEDLDKGPEGEWTVRMVVHHLAHSDAYCLTRIIQLLSEPGTIIRSFSEEALAASEFLHYRSAPIEPALELFAATRSETVRLLKFTSDAELTRSCEHSERGQVTLESMVKHFTNHPTGHIQQILDAVHN